MKNLYLTGILPPHQLAEEIDEIRQECAERFHVKAALKPPVHITLFRPFYLAAEREKDLLKMLSPISYAHDPFEIALENFNTFDSKVVFIQVLKSTELFDLRHHVSKVYNQHQVDPQESKSNNAFHPHITIAYRDIPRASFPAMWSEYKNRKFKRSFTASHFSLLKHDGQKWQRFKEYPLQKPAALSLF